jgi:uncharacterized membrane protein
LIDIYETFLTVLNIIVTTINLMGVIIVIWGFVVAAIGCIQMKLQSLDFKSFIFQTNKIRASLGLYILLGLEFMIAADLIHTFIRPTQEDLVVLVTIVIIRTIISYFLSREVDKASQQEEKAELSET